MFALGDNDEIGPGTDVPKRITYKRGEYVPRQYGTGGKVALMGITKNGDRYLRTLLIHGARCHVLVKR